MENESGSYGVNLCLREGIFGQSRFKKRRNDTLNRAKLLTGWMADVAVWTL